MTSGGCSSKKGVLANRRGLLANLNLLIPPDLPKSPNLLNPLIDEQLPDVKDSGHIGALVKFQYKLSIIIVSNFLKKVLP